ncbi:protein trapped in endoderm-1-like [Patiria miniata]|uniref:G-protein coupled receptors family 1 profile domain-containing protein n=1 Tax=Patiria miniata TaxID=46514 RepID=A0A913ZT21_PATMI|nr:protein trapped in endoderm-1-like [Patiria miniata]
METSSVVTGTSESLNQTLFDVGDHDVFDSPRKYSSAVQYTTLVIGIPVDILGFFGNLMTIVVVSKTPVLRTPTNLFIISLSVSDLMYCCIVLPVLLTTFYSNAWIFGSAFCQVHPLFMFTFVGSTIMSLAGTAFGRYLKITQSPLYGKLFTIKRRAAGMILLCWLLPFIFLLPPITGLWGRLGYEPKTLTCTFLRGGSNSSYSMFFMISALILPTFSITFCYFRILQTVCVNHKRVRKMRVEPGDEISASTETGTSGATKRQQRKAYREDIQYTKMMLCIFLVFIACYVPYMMATLVDPQVNNMTFHFCCGMCVWFSSCLNPIVYVVMNRHFRQACARFLPTTMRGREVTEIVGL